MTASPSIRLLTIDNLPLIHAGVSQMLATFEDIAIAGTACDLNAALCNGAEVNPTIALAEIDALRPDWPGALQQLSAALAVPVVVFTMHSDSECIHRAIRAGAQGYLLKNTQPLALAQALRGIATGQQVFAAEVVCTAFGARPSEHQRDKLSQREREVLTLLACGLSNRAIGARLHLSNATVKYHCGQIFAKLGVESRAQAVALAYTHNLVPRIVVESEAPVAALRHERRAG